jgi:hypothetical protein
MIPWKLYLNSVVKDNIYSTDKEYSFLTYLGMSVRLCAVSKNTIFK